MKMPTLVLAGTATVLLAALARPQETANPPSKGRAEESAKKVKGLQRERIATLKETADVSLKLAQGSRLELEVALEDRMALLKAESEATESEPERIALYKQALDALTAYETLARTQKEAARGTELAVLRVKARRLEVVIRLEQAKAKETNEGK